MEYKVNHLIYAAGKGMMNSFRVDITFTEPIEPALLKIAIREAKRILAAKDELIKNCSEDLSISELKGQFDKYSVKLKSQEAQLKAFCKKAGIRVDSSRTRTVGFGKSTSQKAVGSANRYYKSFSKNYNINNIETLAKYYDVKYTDTQRYRLLQQYKKSIDKGKLSPLAGFDQYESYYYRVENEIVGQVTAAGVKIESQSAHLLERVFGTKADPDYDFRVRNGVKLEDIKEALFTDSNPRYSAKNESYVYKNDYCQVSLSLKGKLTQTNPKKVKKKRKDKK